MGGTVLTGEVSTTHPPANGVAVSVWPPAKRIATCRLFEGTRAVTIAVACFSATPTTWPWGENGWSCRPTKGIAPAKSVDEYSTSTCWSGKQFGEIGPDGLL